MPNKFKTLFALDPGQVHETVLLLPFVPAGALEILGVGKLNKGKLYASASGHNFTVVRTGPGAAAAGDAVMFLAEAPVKRFILVGTCGSVSPAKQPLAIGSLVLPDRAQGMESFSEICENNLKLTGEVFAALPLQEQLWSACAVKPAVTGCLSVGSLYFEDHYPAVLNRPGLEAVDMETAAVFHAARKTGRQASALLCVSDQPGIKPFYSPLNPDEQKCLAEGLNQAFRSLKIFLDTTISSA